MPLKTVGIIDIPNAKGSAFDHAAFDRKTRRVFIAHTARDCIEVIDHEAGRHLATLSGFSGAAGAVVDAGQVVVTNRGSASVAWVDADTFETRATFRTGPRPNGAAIVGRSGWAIVACIGDDTEKPSLQLFTLAGGRQASVALPGRPRWCVTDATGERLYLCIREPSLVLVVGLPDLRTLAQFTVPRGGAHGLDIDHARERLYVACDDSALVELESRSGEVSNVWPIAGPPDVTFFNPATGRVHVAIGEPGVVETVDPRTGERVKTPTGPDAHTTALVTPDRLYVISPSHGGVLVLADAR
jgi:DNA-binding beta-propeller fold protein YncE